MEFDVAVLGGGPGGYLAAAHCAQKGLRTVLIEARELGGTCLNRGCIPTKALLECAHRYQTAKKSDKYGVLAEGVRADYAKMAAFRDRTVLKLRKGVENIQRDAGVTVLEGWGKLVDSHTIMVDDTSITANQIILATGSAPAQPPIPGLEHALNSDQVLAMKELPESFVIVGGGVIGMEFAALFSALDRPVMVLEATETILPGMDEELRGMLQRSFARNRTKIVTGAMVQSIEQDGETVVRYQVGDEEKEQRAACCVVCTGRKPLTDDIGLEVAGVAVENGYVSTDASMRTNIPHIFAIGDMTGGPQFAHAASAQGLVAAANCAGGDQTFSADVVPACVYTDPELAVVGLTEEQATCAGYAVKVGRSLVTANGKAAILGAREGMAKLVVEQESGRVLGAQLLAPRATDMISEIALLMQVDGTAMQLAGTIHPHPTVSEIWMECAQSLIK